MKRQILISLILLSSVLTMRAQNSPFCIFGSGLDGSVYQKSAFYTDLSNGLLIEAPLDPSGNRLPITFSWRGNLGPFPLFIQSDGKIGIGTNQPSEMLHIKGTTSAEIRLESNNGTAYIRQSGTNINLYNNGERLTILNNGLVGIGEAVPSAKLDINGNLRLRDSDVPTWDVGFGSNGDPVRFLSIDAVNSVLPDDPLELVYNRGVGVKIGRDNSDNKYLKVFGLIEAKEIKVLSNINSDFVFESNYKLKPLSDLESFIMKNKHLPDVPSAKEFKEKGQNLAEVDDLLLRKIEELTLYTIEQNKKLELQNQAIEKLMQVIKLQNEKIEKIEAASK